jgi:RND family efflux transporter MFP subunit
MRWLLHVRRGLERIPRRDLLRTALVASAAAIVLVLGQGALFGGTQAEGPPPRPASGHPAAPAPVPAATGQAPAALPPPSYAAIDPAPYHDLDAQPGVEPAPPGRPGNEGSKRADSTLDCLIEPSEVAAIGSQDIGVIQAIRVERSDFVEEGQVLVELQSSVERAALDVARKRAEMDGELRSREASLAFQQHRQERARKLFESKATSLDVREETETDAEVARSQLQQAREEKQLAALQLQQAIEVLNRRTIRSPFSGIVVERLMSPGERVEEKPILRIAKIDPLRVQVILPSAMFGSIRPGQRAAVQPEAPSDRVYAATVTVVDRLIDAASGTFGVQLTLPNPDRAIPSGLHCEVHFVDE